MQNCPSRMYGDSLKQQCNACQSPCYTCSSEQDCISCVKNGTQLLLMYMQRCYTTCPNGTVQIQYNDTCQPCKSPCHTCEQTPDNCKSCLYPLALSVQLQLCVSICPDGHVAVLGVCVICQSPCQRCQNFTTFCTSCIPQYFFLASAGSCFDKCPDGFYSDYSTSSSSGNSLCSPCSPPCKTC